MTLGLGIGLQFTSPLPKNGAPSNAVTNAETGEVLTNAETGEIVTNPEG